MKIRFQADADFDEDIVTGLRRREPGLDFQTALEGRLEALHDREVVYCVEPSYIGMRLMV